MIEHIGNKIPFEKRLNIIASNGYLLRKKKSYRKSKVGILLELSQSNNNWGLDEIRERDIRISDELVGILNDWGLNQSEANVEELLICIPEERFSDYLDFIRIFQNGRFK